MSDVIGHEARCAKCGETFNPADEIDALEHIQREDGTACGGLGIMSGSWAAPVKREAWRCEFCDGGDVHTFTCVTQGPTYLSPSGVVGPLPRQRQ